MRVLGIETSADDTGVALIEATGEFGPDFSFSVLGNAVSSQSHLHAEYGGIYPNLAKHEHQRNLIPLLERVLKESGLQYQGLTLIKDVEKILEREQELLKQLLEFFETHKKPDIDAIAVTIGPGLEPALWVGVNFAKALAHAWRLPIVPVNHMEGHIIISALSGGDEISNFQFPIFKEIQFPMLSLLISGGHTELILSREWMQYEYLGRTRDDAVGEAFDKVARMMGLPYPGGPAISRLAEEARSANWTSDVQFRFPRPMIHEKNYDFSFAGLKTAVLRLVEAHAPLTEDFKKQIAREFEDAVTEVLVSKTMRAVEEYGVSTLVIGGGVSANQHIRSEFRAACKNADMTLLVPPLQYSTDNALMIALAGYFRALKKEFADPDILRTNGNLMLTEGRA